MAVRAIFDQLGIRALSEAKMQAYAEKSIAEFNLINVPEENKGVLLEFAEMLVERQH